MRRPSLDQTIEFVKSLDAARTQEEICARVLAVTRDFGVEHILAGTIPQRGALSQTQKSNILLDRWPRDWAIRYFSRNYIFSDPAIRKLPDGRAFRWSELDAMTRDNPRARLVMNEATEFGLRSGITIPLLPIENEVIGFSLAGRHLEMGPHEESMLLMLASYATGRALVLRDKGRPSVCRVWASQVRNRSTHECHRQGRRLASPEHPRQDGCFNHNLCCRGSDKVGYHCLGVYKLWQT
jgi:LuxR family quorum sensing-dependent transcriptional regulator